MCGRYFIDEKTIIQILKLVKKIDRDLNISYKEDICPSNVAPVITNVEDELTLTTMNWGYPSPFNKGLIINARAESVLEKPTFSKGIKKSRIVIPAKHFYEWNSLKEKNTFYRDHDEVLYMGAIFENFLDARRFVILTTEANDSMIKVHNRMPLILEEGQIETWIRDDSSTEKFLKQRPVDLLRRPEIEQG